MKKTISILLSIVMIFSLCACSNGSTSSEFSVIEEIINIEETTISPNATVTGIIVNQAGETIVIFSDGSQVNLGKDVNIENAGQLTGLSVSEFEKTVGVNVENSGDNNTSNTSSNTDDNTSDTSSDNTSNNSSSTTSDQNNNSTTTSQTSSTVTSSEANNDVNPSDYTGKTVRFISTINPATDESGPVIKNFEKEYGIKVEIILTNLNDHAQNCMALIAAGQSPDVARSNGDFPAFLGYLQSLDAAKLDYTDEIWDKNTFAMSTFGGSPYLCDTVSNIWSEVDIVMYSKSWLKRANVPTPEEFDAQDKWTWDAFFAIGKAVGALYGKEGCGIHLPESFYHAAGGSVYKLQNGKVVNGINNQTIEIMSKYSQAIKDGILLKNKSAITAFLNGEIGITTVHAWSLKKTGDLRNGKWNDYGFYYLPYNNAGDTSRPTTGIFRGWGICKGAKEPVAAGLFLREYLDVNNYDVGGTFITPEAETFFFRANSINYNNYNPYFTYVDLNKFITDVNSISQIYKPMYYDPSQVAASMRTVKGAVDKGAKNINDFILQFTS